MQSRQSRESANQTYLAVALKWLKLKVTLVNQTHIVEEQYQELAVLAGELEHSEHLSPQPALATLSEQFGLSKFESQLLLLCCAVEFDTSLAAACAKAQGNSSSYYPTFSLAMSILDEPTWDVVAPESPLRYWQMIRIQDNDQVPLINRPLRADERIVNYLKGLNHIDARLLPYVKRAKWTVSELPQSHQLISDNIETAVVRALDAGVSDRTIAVQLLGVDRLGKEDVASQLCQRLGLQLYILQVELLPTTTLEIDMLARLWRRETSLLPLCLYVSAYDKSSEPQTWRGLAHFLDAARTIVCLDVSTSLDGLDELLTVEVCKPTTLEQAQIWHYSLSDSTESTLISHITAQFNLSSRVIRKIASSQATSTNERSEDLWLNCRAATRPKLESLTQRIDTKATWNDLVLPEQQAVLLRQIASQVRHRAKVYDEWGFRQKMNRGLGITALFAGPSGTGKTMAAEVLANDLRLDLFRVDLSAVVNKYIGETEKNLRKVFDAADDGGAILFFDEADALFGKRTEVSDSHDRYANMEVNYLLQRMESYRGLAILATNIKGSLDKAFLRRLRFIVDIPLPSAVERKQIWRRAFPVDAPIGNLDYEALSRLKITGGNIHSISLAASFQSAASCDAGGVSMASVKTAIETELLKLEKPSAAIDFLDTIKREPK